MKIRITQAIWAALGFSVAMLAPLVANADIKPAAIFSDHMVIQQGVKVPVWGWAEPGEQVTITLGSAKQSAKADAEGKWMFHLPEQKPGDTMEMTIAGKNSVTIKDILVGEVWVGSGQSNMQFPVSKSRGGYAGLINEEKEIAEANYPNIRMFTGKNVKSYEPQGKLDGQWLVCNPENVPGFSAVGYLFARDLHRELNVPVGIVTVAYGASTAEAWISRQSLAAEPLLKPMLDNFDACMDFYRTNPTAPLDQAPKPPTPINKPRQAGGRQRDPVADQHMPSVLFNGMIHPLIPYAMRGVIWYQGESITGGDGGLSLYSYVQATLVHDWRARWGEGDFPFYVVQLPALKNISNNPRVREGQAQILKLPNTAMAVTIDIGDPKDVHPHNKAPLGERLTKIAMANAYGRKIEYSGPVFDAMKIDGSAARLSFSHLGGGLVAKGGPLKWFQVAGADQKFVDADAKIDRDSIVVSSGQVKQPVAVRYAWDNYPEGCNLYNAADLPAAPFRTDNWVYPIEGIVN
jgi:sialate O-acetylesterase